MDLEDELRKQRIAYENRLAETKRILGMTPQDVVISYRDRHIKSFAFGPPTLRINLISNMGVKFDWKEKQLE